MRMARSGRLFPARIDPRGGSFGERSFRAVQSTLASFSTTTMAKNVEGHAIRSMPDGPEREELMREFAKDFPRPLRLFVGREKTPEKNEAKVILADSKGRERVRIVVDSSDFPRVEILDENGKVAYKIPPE